MPTPNADGDRRIEFDPNTTSSIEYYELLTAVVIPRPIAWVSSVSAAGVDNLAPHSFFTVAGLRPPIVQFTSIGRKDTLRNIEETGEFVVNFAPEGLLDQVNATGVDLPADVSEFDAAGIEREPSSRVRAPRVRHSPVALECRLHTIVQVGGCSVVMGQVLTAAVSDTVLDSDHLRTDLLRPLSRLGGAEWGLTPPIRSVRRATPPRESQELRPAR